MSDDRCGANAMSAIAGSLSARARLIDASPNRRGRPRGTKRRHVVRALLMLGHFEAARGSGMGHTEAVVATIGALQRTHPDMRGVSKREIERVLRELQPRERAEVWHVRLSSNGGALYSGPRKVRRRPVGL